MGSKNLLSIYLMALDTPWKKTALAVLEVFPDDSVLGDIAHRIAKNGGLLWKDNYNGIFFWPAMTAETLAYALHAFNEETLQDMLNAMQD